MYLNKKFEKLFLNVSIRAALSSYHLIGKKDKITADKAAVDSMRNELNKIDMNGEIQKVQILPKGCNSYNPAFDVTPAKYVTGLITERGISEASSDGLKKLFK